MSEESRKLFGLHVIHLKPVVTDLNVSEDGRLDVGAEALGGFGGLCGIRNHEGFSHACFCDSVDEIPVYGGADSEGEKAYLIQIVFHDVEDFFFPGYISVCDDDHASGLVVA